jgi:hypothetical protein
MKLMIFHNNKYFDTIKIYLKCENNEIVANRLKSG